VTGVGAAALFVFFGLLPAYIIAVFQLPNQGAVPRLLLMGVAVGAVVLIPAIGMGMTFPLLADLSARDREARGADVGAAYALNTLGSILGAALTGFVLVVALGTQTTLRVGLVINGVAALLLAGIVARGVTEGSPDERRLRTRVLGGAGLGVLALVAAVSAPGWNTRLIDLGPTIYGRAKMEAAGRRAFLRHAGSRQLAYQEGRNATVSVWETESGRSLRVNGKVDASDRGDMDTQVMLGLAPIAARTGATSALVIGFGSGVTTRVLASVPGMQRVRVVEIEPAVLAMEGLFRHVNGGVLTWPTVHVVVDDARSALQLSPERYDVIVSEPSNPWVAGVATLYTPEFFRIARSRLADDGVFAQWIQLYQLPLPIVAGIVRNLRDVFPNVQILFGGAQDLMVLGSPRPIAYQRSWITRLVGPDGTLRDLAREWLWIDGSDDYFGRLLLGDSGVARLVGLATLEHRDDRPRLEFVAARRFLDADGGAANVFDSLVVISGQSGGAAAPPQMVRILSRRRTDPSILPYLEEMRRVDPIGPDWIARSASVRLGMGDTAAADAMLRPVWTPEALLLRAEIATARAAPDARALLALALRAGADTAQALAALAALAVRAGQWDVAAAQASEALNAARGTFRHPYPALFLSKVMEEIALQAPPALADSVLRHAVARRPGSPRYLELRAFTALRAGRCDDAIDAFAELLTFGIKQATAPQLVRECQAGAP
jgi:spermidine synthase